jgi:hypothetical protein
VAELAVDLDVPSHLLGKTIDHAQAEPGALAGALGGEEGLECPLDDLGRHAGAGIGDDQGHIVAGRDVDVLRRILVVQVRIGGFDHQLTTLRHGITRVDGEVEDRVLELR